MKKLTAIFLSVISVMITIIPASAAGSDTKVGYYTIESRSCVAEFTVSDGTGTVLPGFYATSTVESGSLSVVGVEGYVILKTGSRVNFTETGIYPGTYAFASDSLQRPSVSGRSTHTFGSQAKHLYPNVNIG